MEHDWIIAGLKFESWLFPNTTGFEICGKTREFLHQNHVFWIWLKAGQDSGIQSRKNWLVLQKYWFRAVKVQLCVFLKKPIIADQRSRRTFLCTIFIRDYPLTFSLYSSSSWHTFLQQKPFIMMSTVFGPVSVAWISRPYKHKKWLHWRLVRLTLQWDLHWPHFHRCPCFHTSTYLTNPGDNRATIVITTIDIRR